MKERILKIRNLNVSFTTGAGKVNIVRGANLDVFKDEVIAVVGESGSGKSVLAKAIMGLLSNKGSIESGSIEYTYQKSSGEIVSDDLVKCSKEYMKQHILGRRIAMVFQDSMTTLNPTMIIGEQMIEGMMYHFKTPKEKAQYEAIKLLKLVGISNPKKQMNKYPHELPEETRQLVAIAIALACKPDILICDEPTAGFDVTIQEKILALIKKIQVECNVTIIYNTDDLGIVANIAQYVAVMYAGKIIEKGPTTDIFYDPKHPYTWGLLSLMSNENTTCDSLFMIPGNLPNPLLPVTGDAFAPRNPFALKIDFKQEPLMFKVNERHWAATWLLHPQAPKAEMPKQLEDYLAKLKKKHNMSNHY